MDDKAATSSATVNKLVTLPDGRRGSLVGLHREVTLEYGKTKADYGSVSKITARELLCDVIVDGISVTVPYAKLSEVN